MPRKRRRNSRSLYLVCAAVLGAQCLLYWVLTSTKLDRGAGETATAANYVDPSSVRPAATRRRSRPVYPYSVIRGGAYSVAEFDAALRADPVAAAHYAVFHRTQMRLTPAPESVAVYVSYRQGDGIYWTRRKVRVAAKEALLTDGIHAARARCGNRVSLTPESPVGATEPLAEDMDLPELPPPADEDASAGPLAGASMLVDEIFPSLLAPWPPGGVPGGAAGSPFGPYVPSSPGGAPFPVGPAPQPPGSTVPPATPGSWPEPFYPQPLPPEGPGGVWNPPFPQPVGPGTGNAPGSPPPTAGPAPPAEAGHPPGGGSIPPPGTSPLPSPGGGTRTYPGGLPLPPASSSGTLPPIEGGALPPPNLPPPDAPPPVYTEIPEPATAALLLGGALVAYRLLSRRRLG